MYYVIPIVYTQLNSVNYTYSNPRIMIRPFIIISKFFLQNIEIYLKQLKLFKTYKKLYLVLIQAKFLGQ